MTTDLWTYRQDVTPADTRIDGFDVEAADGNIGTIDEATYDIGESAIVVDTGFWIFGRKRLIPASSIAEIDLEHETVRLTLTKAQIKDAPDYDRERSFREDPGYRDDLTGYYGQFPLM